MTRRELIIWLIAAASFIGALWLAWSMWPVHVGQ